MVTLRKVSNSEKEHISRTASLPTYEDVMRQNEQYPHGDAAYSVDPREKRKIKKIRMKRPRLGRKPVETFCQMCGMQILTTTDYQISFLTHATAATILCVGFWPIAWAPYVLPFCKVVNHYCPNCHAYIGKQ